MVALGSLFAPAYIAGDQQSADAVNAWMAQNYSMTNPKVEQTRTPVSFNTGHPEGMVDVEALRALAQGGAYDMDARRNAIAAQVQANQAAAAQQQQQQQPSRVVGPGSPLYIPPNDQNLVAGAYGTPKIAGYDDSWLGYASGGPQASGPYSGGGPVAPGLAPPQVMLGVS